MINLVNILKYCPKGTKLYSPVFGEVIFKEISNSDNILCKVTKDSGNITTTSNQFHIEEGDAVQIYISNIEKEIGVKLNLKALEARKDQPKFKDGDIVVIDAHSLCYSKCIFILKGDLYTDDNRAHSYIFYNINNKYIDFYVTDIQIKDREIRLATDLEKLQLFDMLTVKGKYWDAEKKQIVNIKLEDKLKPFDKVLVRNGERQAWQISLFGYKTCLDYYCCNGSSWSLCIPYKGNEHLVGTTNNP